RRKGYLDGRNLAEVFAWLRPGDLIWNYWVNNYLLGRKAAAFDILFWNADTTRMSAQLHADFVDVSIDNALARPNMLTARGVPSDLSQIKTDTYLVAGIADHLTPGACCGRSPPLPAQLVARPRGWARRPRRPREGRPRGVGRFRARAAGRGSRHLRL